MGIPTIASVTAAPPLSAAPPRPTRAAVTGPPIPREHGAWGILLIPFATACGIRGTFDFKLALLLASALCFYTARTSFLKRNVTWTALLLAGSAACLAPLLFVWHLWWLVALGIPVAPLAFRKTEHSVIRQLLAVCGLALTAPAAWYVATGRLDRDAGFLWALNVLYFAGGVFYVKMHIAAAIRRKPLETIRERLRISAGVLTYHSLLAVIGALLWPVGLVFTPAVVRSIIGVWRLSPTLRIKRLGWTEVAYSIVFAAALILALHGRF